MCHLPYRPIRPVQPTIAIEPTSTLSGGRSESRADGVLPAIAWMSLILTVAAAFWIGASYFEAAAYRRVTGKEVSTLDAMFLDLRVQEPVRLDVSDSTRVE